MKYLKKYAIFESKLDDSTPSGKPFHPKEVNKNMINLINDICLDLSDSGFTSDRNGRSLGGVMITPSHGFFYTKSSYIGISKKEPFNFDEIKDAIYRIKEVVGIENISTFNYIRPKDREYTISDLKQLENETLNLGVIRSCFMVFDFPVVEPDAEENDFWVTMGISSQGFI